uniref:Ig-like domain-containing protein n=1 Tax=Oryctolagus cuniculus TaxID=9986 RepID=G1U5T3_RABIT
MCCKVQGVFPSINMLSVTCSVLLIFIFRSSSGDSVTQMEGLVSLSEGASLALSCTYQTTYLSPFLFWYIQYPNKALQLLLRSTTENQRTESQGFWATLVKSNSSFHLHKSSLQISDSAVYYCAMTDTVRGTTGGAEHKPKGPRGLQLSSQGRGECCSPCRVYLLRLSSRARTSCKPDLQ